MFHISIPPHCNICCYRGGGGGQAQVWAHVYGRDNLNVAPEDHAVLLTEAPLNPYKNRRQCAETFFENFGVPAMFCAPQVCLGTGVGDEGWGRGGGLYS